MKNKNKIIISIVILLIICASGAFITIESNNKITLIQLHPNTESQMMGYIIKTKNDTINIIDGGTTGDSSNLLEYINQYGRKVDNWFLTHPHKDHVGAFSEIVKLNLDEDKTNDIQIENIYVTLNPIEWIKQYETERYEEILQFYELLENQEIKNKIKSVNYLDEYKVDNVIFTVLGTCNEEITINPINNSSMILKVTVNNTNILFLADTGVESGQKLLNRGIDIKSKYVQMAHHGQAGAEESVYKCIQPTYCLWPTPEWLWNNDRGEGVNTAEFTTFETRKWIENLNVKQNYIAKDGDISIEIR